MTRSRMLMLSSFTFVGLGAALLLSLYVFGPARAAVGPLPAEALALPAGTRVLAGFDVARFVQSPLYQRIKAEKGPDPFKELREKTGLDPERDLDRVVLAGGRDGGRDGGKDRGVVMAFGRFDGYALGRELEKREGVTWKQHAGATVYLFDESSKSAGALAFLDGDVVVVGERAAVEETLTNRERGTTLRTNAELTALLERVKPGSTFWLVGDRSAVADLPSAIPAPGAGAQIGLPPLRGVIVTGELEPELALDVTADAADAEAARKLADVVRGLVALVSLQTAHKPELKGLDLTTAVAVTTEAQRVKLALRVSYELLDALKAQAQAAAQAKKAEAARPQ